jgi:NADPH:quinone reductase-like Zn-dependent oxidoreductase
MRAVVVSTPGGPEVLEIKNLPKPSSKPGHVLIRVKAFGINRSEMFTRQGKICGNFYTELGLM